MANFESTQEVKINLPAFFKTLELEAGGKIANDADVLSFAQKQVPVGKRATVQVSFIVTELEDV